MPLVPKHIQKLQAYKPGQNIAEIQRKLGLNNIIKLAENEKSNAARGGILRSEE